MWVEAAMKISGRIVVLVCCTIALGVSCAKQTVPGAFAADDAGNPPPTSCKAETSVNPPDDCGATPPSAADILRARTAIEFYATTPPATGHAADGDHMSVTTAVRTLLCDRSPGWQRQFVNERKALTAIFRTNQIPPGDPLRSNFESYPAMLCSALCCSRITDCRTEKAIGRSAFSAVRFNISVSNRSYEDVAKIVDPQSWGKLGAAGFENAFLGDQCPPTQNVPDELCPPQPGNSALPFPGAPGTQWKGKISENFTFDCNSQPPNGCTAYCNSLDIKSDPDPLGTNPYLPGKKGYKMRYQLCRAYKATIQGIQYPLGLLKEDCGFTLVEPDGSGSKVTAAKWLEVDPNQCGGSCDTIINSHLNFSQLSLVEAAANALCDGQSPGLCNPDADCEGHLEQNEDEVGEICGF
jgi:hypothetical protein